MSWPTTFTLMYSYPVWKGGRKREKKEKRKKGGKKRRREGKI